MERFPYRYIQCGILEINGKPDCRIQKVDSYTGRYRDMYLCDNEMQLLTAMEDHDYTCWLDPDGVFLPIVKTRYRLKTCLLYTSPSPRDATLSRMPSSA